MQFPFDHLAKKVAEGALGALGATDIDYPIARDTQRADIRHDPDPARTAERARLGLLGKIAEVLCFIEVYAHPPDGREIRACLTKHFDHWEQCERKARANNEQLRDKGLPAEPVIQPFLWILASTVSASVLRKLSARRAPSYPPGVYVAGDDLFRLGIIVASQLPRDRTTLLVRLMAAGRGLANAVSELGALPEDAIERVVAEGIVVHLEEVLGKKPSRPPEEEEFIVTMGTTWAQARQIGRDEGRAEEAARAVLTAFRVRGIAVPDGARERILAQTDPSLLERWYEKAIVAVSVDEVIDEPS